MELDSCATELPVSDFCAHTMEDSYSFRHTTPLCSVGLCLFRKKEVCLFDCGFPQASRLCLHKYTWVLLIKHTHLCILNKISATTKLLNNKSRLFTCSLFEYISLCVCRQTFTMADRAWLNPPRYSVCPLHNYSVS